MVHAWDFCVKAGRRASATTPRPPSRSGGILSAIPPVGTTGSPLPPPGGGFCKVSASAMVARSEPFWQEMPLRSPHQGGGCPQQGEP